MRWAVVLCGAFIPVFAGAKMPVVLNNDSTHFQQVYPPEKMTEEGAVEYFEEMNKGGTTHFFINANAHNAPYDSKVFDSFWSSSPGRKASTDIGYVANTKLLHDRGVDPPRIWIDCCRRRGISPWLSFRVNDIHDINQPLGWSRSRFWTEHPEFRRVPGSDGSRSWHDAALDFMHEEVRARAVAMCREMMERWDADGFECDFLRFFHHVRASAEGTPEAVAAMTDFMRGVRKAADEVGRRRGRRILVGVRVASQPAAAVGLGTDAVAWAREGLVDWVIVGNFWTCIDFELPCAEWRRALKAANPNVKFLVSFDMNGVYRAQWFSHLSRPECCALCERMYAEGCDGFYFFNLFRHEPGSGVHRLVQIEGIGGEEKVRGEERVYAVTHHDAVPAGMSAGVKCPTELSSGRTFPILIGKVGSPAWATARLSFNGKVDGATACTLSVNGVRATGCSECPRDSWLSPKSPATDVYDFAVPVSALRDGRNEIAIGPSATAPTLCSVDLMLGARISPGVTAGDSGSTYARDAIGKYVESGELPGAISVLYSDGVQETCLAGYSDVSARRPVSMDDAVMQGSQTKGFCGVTVAMLIEEGKLGLDDPVSKYLPEFGTLWVERSNTNGTRVLVKAQNAPTVRQVMNHTGGFRFELPSFQTLGGWSRRMPLRSVAAMAAALPLLFEPGTSVQYSNLGIDIGGAIVEAVTGERWEDFLQRRVLDPLEMKGTGFRPTDGQLANRMNMYDVAGGTVAKWKLAHPSMQGPYNDDRVFPSAGAGLWTTARDQLKFYKMLMNLGLGENGVRILREETVKTLMAKSTRPKGMGGYSLGLFAPEEDAPDAWFGHDGAWGTDGKVNWHKKQLRLWVVQIWGKPRPWDDAMRIAADRFFGQGQKGLNAGAGSDNAK